MTFVLFAAEVKVERKVGSLSSLLLTAGVRMTMMMIALSNVLILGAVFVMEVTNPQKVKSS